jgi:hypothetical protein
VIACDTAALLVGTVEDVLGRMKAKVARAKAFLRLDPRGGVGGKMASVFVEPELKYRIWPICLPNRFQYVIV